MEKGKVIGGALLVAATAAVWVYPGRRGGSAAEPPLRPVRTLVIPSGRRMPDLRFAGTVKANESRTLMFKQAGRIATIPVGKGQAVRRGETLATLDPLDFRNRLTQAEAAAKRDRLTFGRKSDAAKKNAISQEEVSQAEAQLRQSEAALELAQRALAETVLVAPFDCTVADIPAAELDMVGTASPVVTVQDMSKIKVDVVYPEAAVIAAKKLRSVAEDGSCGVEISFDSLPAKRYPAKFVEYVGRADERTQTYRATYEMLPPDDLLILPGMSATLYVSGESYVYGDAAETGVVVPESAVAVDSAGAAYAVRIDGTSEPGVFRASRVAVKLGHPVADGITVESGLSAGTRVATAGVSLLSDGDRVRILGD